MHQVRTFAEIVAASMARHGIASPAMAKRIGVTPMAVRMWLHGITTPTAPTAAAFCAAFGVDPAECKKAIELSRQIRRSPSQEQVLRAVAGLTRRQGAQLVRDVGAEYAGAVPLVTVDKIAAGALPETFAVALADVPVVGVRAVALCSSTRPVAGQWAIVLVAAARLRFDCYDEKLYGQLPAFTVVSLQPGKREDEKV